MDDNVTESGPISGIAPVLGWISTKNGTGSVRVGEKYGDCRKGAGFSVLQRLRCTKSIAAAIEVECPASGRSVIEESEGFQERFSDRCCQWAKSLPE